MVDSSSTPAGDDGAGCLRSGQERLMTLVVGQLDRECSYLLVSSWKTTVERLLQQNLHKIARKDGL